MGKKTQVILGLRNSVSSIFPLWFQTCVQKSEKSKSLINSRSKTKVQPSHVVLRSPTAQSVAAPQDSGSPKTPFGWVLTCLEVCRTSKWLVSNLGSWLELNVLRKKCLLEMATFFDHPMSFLLRMDHGNVKELERVWFCGHCYLQFRLHFLPVAWSSSLLSNRPSHVLLCKIPPSNGWQSHLPLGIFLKEIYSTENWVNHSDFCINLFAWNLPWNGSFKFGCMFKTFLIKRIRNARKPKFGNGSLW